MIERWPIVTRNEPPVYPEQARLLGIGGDVGLRLTIDEAGVVTNIGVIRSAGDEFDKAAVAMASRMEFTPARTGDGCPARVAIEYKVRFRLGSADSP